MDSYTEDNKTCSTDDGASHLSEAGRIGGRARTEAKIAAVRANIAKARAKREYYRRHPEARPDRQVTRHDDDTQQGSL